MGYTRFSLKPRSPLIIAIAVLVILSLWLMPSLSGAVPPPDTNSPPPTPAIDQALSKLPPPRPHPLPSTLAQRPTDSGGDYFDQVQPSPVGALIWSSFPITVYIQPITAEEQSYPFLTRRAQGWITAVQRAVQEWNSLLPMTLVQQPQSADITIQRSALPLRLESARNEVGDRRLTMPRARSAETRYEFYAKQLPSPEVSSVLAHRMSIYIRPDQAIDYLQAAARHELGHALGIWGHSPKQTDALYFSQVRHPAPISNRDINTLKRIYAQPTRLGWVFESQNRSN